MCTRTVDGTVTVNIFDLVVRPRIMLAVFSGTRWISICVCVCVGVRVGAGVGVRSVIIIIVDGVLSGPRVC